MTPIGRPAAHPLASQPRAPRAPARPNTQSGPFQGPHRSPLTPARPLTRPPQPSQRPSETLGPPRTGQEAATGPLKGSSRVPHGRGVNAASTSSPNPRSRSFKVGIEAEFYITALDAQRNKGNLSQFVETLTKDYNDRVHRQHPRMRESLRPQNYKGEYKEWCLAEDNTITPHASAWALELVSPIFEACPDSTWRKDVDKMWQYLKQFYMVTKKDKYEKSSCGTHIHIGQEPDFDLKDIKLIAQAAVHFEPAIEFLVPEERRGNPFAKGIVCQSSTVPGKGLSRSALIAAIENVPDNDHPGILLDLVQPTDPTDPISSENKAFHCWNFLSLKTHRSIEFRKPPASLSSNDALTWAEFALCFVLASIHGHLSPAELLKFTPTVGGLRLFLAKYGNKTRVTEAARLVSLFRSKPAEGSMPVQESRSFGPTESARSRKTPSHEKEPQRLLDEAEAKTKERLWQAQTRNFIRRTLDDNSMQ